MNTKQKVCPLAVMKDDAEWAEKARDATLSYPEAVRAGRESEEARAKVAELVAADREYDEARRGWDYAIQDPEAYRGEDMERVASLFESAIARRAAALAAFSEARS